MCNLAVNTRVYFASHACCMDCRRCGPRERRGSGTMMTSSARTTSARPPRPSTSPTIPFSSGQHMFTCISNMAIINVFVGGHVVGGRPCSAYANLGNYVLVGGHVFVGGRGSLLGATCLWTRDALANVICHVVKGRTCEEDHIGGCSGAP